MSEQLPMPVALDEDGNEIKVEEEGQQYLTFSLAGEVYGVDILRVEEIRGWGNITRIPNQSSFMKGVVNLRGSIVPIFDLRERFELGYQEYTKDTVVVVLNVKSELGDRIMGIVVDAVSDVLNATKEAIRNTPDFGSKINTRCISGLASSDDIMIMLLDVDRLLNLDEISVSDVTTAA